MDGIRMKILWIEILGIENTQHAEAQSGTHECAHAAIFTPIIRPNRTIPLGLTLTLAPNLTHPRPLKSWDIVEINIKPN